MWTSRTLKRAALGIAAGSVVVAAFATIAPSQQETIPPASQAFTEALNLNLQQSMLPQPATYLREERFQRGDTLSGLLGRLGIDESQHPALVRTRALQTIRPGYFVTAEVGGAGELRSL